MFTVQLPIFIPSLFRKTLRKNKDYPLIQDCLNNILKNYQVPAIHVFAQEFPDEHKNILKIEYPNVHWHWIDKRLGVPGTFEEIRKYACEHYDAYIHIDDDIIISSDLPQNSTLCALEHVYNLMPNRIGLVTTANTSLSHFRRVHDNHISVYGNPAMVVLINNKFAKECSYDLRFPKWRSDTDFSQQIAKAGGIPLIINKHFLFEHTVNMSKKVDKKFEIKLHNTVEQHTNNRDEESKQKEYSLLQEKWPLIKTTKRGSQLLLKSIKTMCSPTKDEITFLNQNFPWHLVSKKDLKAT